MPNKNNTEETKIEISNIDYKLNKVFPENNNTNLKHYLHSIRNMRLLDKEKMNNISNMTNEEKMEVIVTFNDTFEILLKNLSDCLED